LLFVFLYSIFGDKPFLFESAILFPNCMASNFIFENAQKRAGDVAQC
jgi:hypothetical protein